MLGLCVSVFVSGISDHEPYDGLASEILHRSVNNGLIHRNDRSGVIEGLINQP